MSAKQKIYEVLRLTWIIPLILFCFFCMALVEIFDNVHDAALNFKVHP